MTSSNSRKLHMCLIFYRKVVLGITEKNLPRTFKIFVVHAKSEKLMSVCTMKPSPLYSKYVKNYKVVWKCRAFLSSTKGCLFTKTSYIWWYFLDFKLIKNFMFFLFLFFSFFIYLFIFFIYFFFLFCLFVCFFQKICFFEMISLIFIKIITWYKFPFSLQGSPQGHQG